MCLTRARGVAHRPAAKGRQHMLRRNERRRFIVGLILRADAPHRQLVLRYGFRA
jgi:hypothetical protein